MHIIKSRLSQWNMANKRIFLRADLNVPLQNGIIMNDFRLQSILPTLDFILNKNGSVVLATHIGEPKEYDPKLSTQLLVSWFEKKGYSIIFSPHIDKVSHYPIIPKQIILLENLRFFPGEKTAHPFFAKQLAQTAHYYVNDAFGVIHRNDCSVSVLPYEFSENRRTIGFLIEKELHILSRLQDNPERPFLAIIGGGKVADKIPLIQGLLHTADTIMVCPALCFSFLKALAKPVGLSLVDDAKREICKKIILQADNYHKKLLFPIDYQVAHKSIYGHLSISTDMHFPNDAIGISIGPKTIELIENEIKKAKTIFFNCAMGFGNRPETLQGTKAILNAMADATGKTVIAGGDSIQIAYDTGVATSIDYLSVGGGAALAYLSGSPLPGLIAFEEE